MRLGPDAFAVVMATGIVAVAAADHGFWVVSWLIGGLATLLFVVLAVMGVRQLVGSDAATVGLQDADHVFRAFTLVAAVSVLGVIWRAWPAILWGCAFVAAAGWLTLLVLLVRALIGRRWVDLRREVRGSWLLVSVGTSGLAITAADVAMGDAISWLLPVAVVLWIAAMIGYLGVMVLFVARIVAGRSVLLPMTPDAWIVMGALAIAALAGGHLIAALDANPGWLPGRQSAFVTVATIVIWAFASAWNCAIAVAHAARLSQAPQGLRYANVWWSLVFPLGMYSSATALLSDQWGVSALTVLSALFLLFALAAWVVVAIGSLRDLRRRRIMHRSA